MKTSVLAAYTLTNFECDSSEISKVLALQPTKTWKLGDSIGRSSLCYEHNGWSLSVQIPGSEDLEEHIAQLLNKLSPAWDKLIKLGHAYDAEFACVIYSYKTQGPGVHLSKKMLQSMAEINAEFDVDYYCMKKKDTN
jgi:hypothetical protein